MSQTTLIDVAYLLRRVEAIERALGMPRPPAPAHVPIFDAAKILKPLYAYNKCSRCGIDWLGVMGYVCQVDDCPIQPRVTCSAAPTTHTDHP